MSKLLIPSNPVVIIPELAELLGFHEAAILQQIHYWLDGRSNKNFIDGKYWVYNTYEEWQKQFPWMSIPTLKRKIQSLEAQGIIISAYHNRTCLNRTKYYTIDYELFTSLVNRRTDQNDPLERIKMIRRSDQNDPMTITETISETTTESVVVNFEFLLNIGFGINDAKSLVNEFSLARCQEVVKYVKSFAEPVNNPAAYVRTLLVRKASLSKRTAANNPHETPEETLAKMKPSNPSKEMPDYMRVLNRRVREK
jgi:hypothetical protein